MKRKNLARNALFTSILSLLLCVSMLVGTTFAWFTDEVTSGMNTIAAGNLDIELEYYDGSAWQTVSGATDLFTGNLWEPGHTEVVYLKLSNLGTLALKYQLGINVAAETEGTNVANEPFKLSDYIYMGVVEGAEPTYTTREESITAAKAGANGIIGNGFTTSGSMTAQQEALYLAVVVYMPENVTNEANYKTGTTPPQIDLGINVLATQEMYEEDSFDETYDDLDFAPDFIVGESHNYLLTNDVAVTDKIYFGDNTTNTIDLNGKTVTTTSNFVFGAQGANCVLEITGDGTVATDTGYAGFANKGSTLIVSGGNFELGEITQAAHFYTQNSATTIINGGTFISTDPNTPILYCINGFIEINGGFFQNTANPSQALLSMGNNLNYVNNQKITLRGGTFVNWNPMDSAFAKDWPQTPALIVLAEGYKMISETQANGDVWYTVVPE